MSKIHFSTKGSGKPVLFLHGFLESSSMWNYLDFTDKALQCIYVDIPGHGESDIPNFVETEITINSFAKSIIHKLSIEGIEKFDIVGHSMGGYVALAIAKQVDFKPKVILLNSNFWDDTLEKKKNRDRVISIISTNKDLFIQEAIPGLFIKPNENKEAINQLIHQAKKLTIEGITIASKAMRDRPDLTEYAYSISHELVCIQGEKDSIISERDMMIKCNNKIPYITIPNAGHMAHIEASKIVQKTISDLLLDLV